MSFVIAEEYISCYVYKLKTTFCTISFIILIFPAFAQLAVDCILQKDVEHTVNYLVADSLKGRGNFTPELYKAAHFIADKFNAAGLKTFPLFDGFFQPFQLEASKEKIRDSVGNYLPEKVLLNVVGVLQGKSKPDEAIIFSAHYDHVGIQRGAIHNGANDNASGTAAVLALAEYFSKRNDNERTIIFCAFAGEELGLWGSTVFVPQVAAEKIVAVINIEMIGRTTVGKNAFFITGAHYSDVSRIIAKALMGKAKIKREPDSSKQLFNRSDNFPFALKGIPAHSIMSSDDSDDCYHQPCDDVQRLDVTNMTNIIKAIAVGTSSLINGNDTPKRIKVSQIN